jgi:hypothetical protein
MERAGQKAYKLCVWVLQEQLRLCRADLPDVVVIRREVFGLGASLFSTAHVRVAATPLV